MGLSKSRKLEITAYHEAGHAVAAVENQVKFKYVTIDPDSADGSLGHVLYRLPNWLRDSYSVSSDRRRLLGERYIIVNFAGQVAQAKFDGKQPRWGMHGDNQSAVNMAFRLGLGSQKTTEAFLRYCFYAAEDLVARQRRDIECLAAALLERKTLNYEDALEVIFPGSKALRATARKLRVKPEQSIASTTP